ncbi:MAG: hypothetical protein ABFD50_02870 [Smithella sp.]
MKKGLLFLIAVVFAVVTAVSFPINASADVIWNQPDVRAFGVPSQTYPGTSYNWMSYDDFTTTQSYTNIVVNAYGTAIGGSLLPVGSYWAKIFNYNTKTLVASTEFGYETQTGTMPSRDGGIDALATLTLYFNSFVLPTGHYWISVGTFASPNYNNWVWNSTPTVAGAEARTTLYGSYDPSDDFDKTINDAFNNINCGIRPFFRYFRYCSRQYAGARSGCSVVTRFWISRDCRAAEETKKLMI